MYVSDFGYAAYPDAWNHNLIDEYDAENVKTNNWLYLGNYEWTVSRCSDIGYYAWYVYDTGGAYRNYVSDNYGVRPSFYLTSTTTIARGE